MNLSQKGRTFIQGWESFRLVGYPDIRGIPTAGWGHTGPDVKIGEMYTLAQAEEWFTEDTQEAVDCVNRCVKVTITQDQFDALVSFTYNVGVGAFGHSTLLMDLNGGLYELAANQFLRWDYAGKEQIPGLENRRRAERDLFLGGSNET